MKLLSINSWGGLNDWKQCWIREIIKKERLDVIRIQETKCVNFEESFIRTLWGSVDYGFTFNPSNGLSGGTLIIWNPSSFSKDGVLSDPHFLGVFGSWNGINEKVFSINIYGPQSEHLKSAL